METSADLFIPFVLLSFVVGAAASHLFCEFCENVRLTTFRLLYFGLLLVILSLFIIGIMTSEITKAFDGSVSPENIFAFSTLFFLSAISGLTVMLPNILEAMSSFSNQNSN